MNHLPTTRFWGVNTTRDSTHTKSTIWLAKCHHSSDCSLQKAAWKFTRKPGTPIRTVEPSLRWVYDNNLTLFNLQVKSYIWFLQNPGYMKEKFKLVIETLHAPDKGYQDNVSVILSWVFFFFMCRPVWAGCVWGSVV